MSYNISTYVKKDLLAGLQERDRLSFHRQSRFDDRLHGSQSVPIYIFNK